MNPKSYNLKRALTFTPSDLLGLLRPYTSFNQGSLQLKAQTPQAEHPSQSTCRTAVKALTQEPDQETLGRC